MNNNNNNNKKMHHHRNPHEHVDNKQQTPRFR